VLLTFGSETVLSGSSLAVDEIRYAPSILQYLLNGLLIGWGLVLAWGQTGLRRPRRVLLLGADDRAQTICRDIGDKGKRRYQVAGFFHTGAADGAHILGLPVWGSGESLCEVIHARRVQELVVTRPCAHTALPAEDLMDCRVNGVRVVDYHAFHETLHRRVPLTSMLACHLLFSSGFDKGWATGAAKRALDVTLTLLFLPLCVPLFALIAVVIRLDSPGPVFYRQERLGLRGRPYTVWKFRSMRVDAEIDGPRQAEKADPRITRVGSWLRRMRLDELPQLINVLEGTMSLIGPRPERSCFACELEQQIPYYRHRTAVRPGITGWAQVNADYALTLEEHREKLEYDLYYIKNLSLWLDLKILVATVGVVLCGRGR
jgi:exopolysaccharide biosynthesis polyprenyl glycosylphosphotransferase